MPLKPPPAEPGPLPEPLVPDTPLTAWLRTVLLGAVLLPLIALVIVGWWGYQRALEEERAIASRASQLAHEHAMRALAIAEDVGRRVGELAAGPDEEILANEPALRVRVGDLVTGLPSIVNINVWDAQGHPLIRSDTAVDRSASVGDRAYFQAHRNPALRVGFSEVLFGRQSGKELMNLTLRRPSADGSFRGIVAVSLSPGFFRDYYKALSADDPRLASFALVRDDGEILARWPATPDGGSHVPPGALTLQRLQEGATSGHVIVPARGQRETRLVSFRALPGYPAYVTAGFSHAAMIDNWLRFLGQICIIVLPVTAGLAYVSWLALQKTRREHAVSRQLQEESRRRASAERSMLESQKLETLAVLTGGVAHDFNNLLAVISTSLHLHRRKHPEQSNEPQVQAMGRAVRSGVRLTRQLLSFARRQALNPETIELQEWLPSVAQLIRSTLVASIQAEFIVEPDTLPVHVDVGELELALINLAVNAKHAMPTGGSFRIVARNASAERSAGRAMVMIAAVDSGVGIPADVLPRVMEPFFTTRARGAGSGLGLSQVHGFCTQAGGTLYIESEVGHGTEVQMMLPAASVALRAETVVPDDVEAYAAALEGRLLLVEDNDEVAQSMLGMLVGSGLDVTRVGSAAEALRFLRETPTPPDVVLSDIQMPGGMDGMAMAFQLRNEWPGLPVILMTGYADQLSKAVHGGLQVLPKPVPPEELLGRLRAALTGKSVPSDSPPGAPG